MKMKKTWWQRICVLMLCFSLAAAGLATGTPTASAASSSSGIVGEWIQGTTVYDAGVDGAATIIGRCAEMGITDVYLLVKGTAGTLGYLNTQYTENLSRTDRDILQEVIDAAKPYGIRVHAWICCMEDAAYKTANPESGMYHYVRGQDNNRINPYDEGYQEYMCNIVTELLTNYDIDGIHLDYIRYNHLCNGWSDTDRANLEALGADLDHLDDLIDQTFYDSDSTNDNAIFDAYYDNDEDVLILAKYRRDNVVDFAETIIAAARAADSSTIISAALQPDGATDPAFGDLHYGQSYADSVGLYDYICPMAYSNDFSQGTSWVVSTATSALAYGNKVVIGLQAYYPAKSAQLMDEINSTQAISGISGYVLFRNSQFGYAKVSYDTDAGEMTIKIINPGGAYQWVQIDLQDGLTATSASVVDGFLDSTTVEIAEDGSYVKFSGTNILASNSEGTLYLTFTGDVDETTDPALVRIYITNESRALNVYENVTPHTHTEAQPVIENNVDATCTEDGSYYSVVYCSECGEELSRTKVTVEATGHTWDDGIVTTEATCTENGVMTYTCTVCGETKTEDINATGHSYTAEIIAPTYTEQGYTIYTCTVCGDSYIDDYTDVLVIDGTDTSLSTRTVVQELTAVPEELQSLYSDVDALTSYLVSLVTVDTGYTEANTAVYDVMLQYSIDGGAWITATTDNFPAEGITVTLPYPDGTDSSYSFVAANMFTETSTRQGTTAGDTGLPTVTNTDDGIQITITGTSAVAISWKTVSTPTTDTTGSSSAKTGDSSMIGLYVALMVISVLGIGGAGAGYYFYYRKRRS